MRTIRIDDAERLSEQTMADELGIDVDLLRALVDARYFPEGMRRGEWARDTLDAFLPLWNREDGRRHYTACACVAAFERVTNRPGILGRCNTCGSWYLTEGL